MFGKGKGKREEVVAEGVGWGGGGGKAWGESWEVGRRKVEPVSPPTHPVLLNPPKKCLSMGMSMAVGEGGRWWGRCVWWGGSREGEGGGR